jgi:hypothetical protein
MARKRHPADLADDRRIAAAGAFVVAFRKSPHERYRVEAGTLAEARRAAAALDAEHGRFGRRAIIYAITPEGVQLAVPEGFPFA